MTHAWIAVAGVGAVTIALKGAGPLVFARRPLPGWLRGIMPLLAPCLLAALAGALIALALTPLLPPGAPIVFAVAGAPLALGVRR